MGQQGAPKNFEITRKVSNGVILIFYKLVLMYCRLHLFVIRLRLMKTKYLDLNKKQDIASMLKWL